MLVSCQPKEATVRTLLHAAHVDPYQALDWQDGRAVPARSGYILETGDRPGTLRLSYSDLSCAEQTEARFHDRIREALNTSDSLVAEQIDTARVRNVGVRVKGVRPMTTADVALLVAARAGHLHRHGSTWISTEPDAELRTRLVPDLILTGWIGCGSDGLAELTTAGAAVLATPADLTR
ncbi:hypothetical protein ACFWXO_16630 [Kitasatospora sp. NPDC059088]|uniref:hypothetical protein n=1 Tax=Kitasatospora sp. NPDC059088 TaxID=3346722 RepID=UPI0036D0AB83